MNAGRFTLHTRVSDALTERPALYDLLPAFHPAFEKLRHPVLGKVMPRLVTIGQAARVAGVDAEALLEVFNLLGPPQASSLASAERRCDPPPPWALDTPVVELDATPILDAGEDPFSAIMQALRSLPQGSVFRVRAPFEPAPLVALLGKRGWVPHVTWEGDVCLASFWRPDVTGDIAPDDDVRALLAERLRGDRLDVRGLEPPQPMLLVLAAVERVLPLTVHHERVPALLLPRLEGMGLRHAIAQDGADVVIRIDRRTVS